MKIRTAIQDFLVEIEIRKYTPKTQRGYRTNLKVFLKYCEEELQITDMVDLDMAVVKRSLLRCIRHGTAQLHDTSVSPSSSFGQKISQQLHCHPQLNNLVIALYFFIVSVLARMALGTGDVPGCQLPFLRMMPVHCSSDFRSG